MHNMRVLPIVFMANSNYKVCLLGEYPTKHVQCVSHTLNWVLIVQHFEDSMQHRLVHKISSPGLLDKIMIMPLYHIIFYVVSELDSYLDFLWTILSADHLVEVLNCLLAQEMHPMWDWLAHHLDQPRKMKWLGASPTNWLGPLFV